MLDIESISRIYMIGIKGVAMTSLAEILKSKGIKVSGSDTNDTFYTDLILKELKIKVFEGFNSKNIDKKADAVIYSTAYNEKNQELKFALNNNFKVFSYPQFLGFLFKQKKGIAVCGTHGKTTTSALLATVLKELDYEPTALIGSKVNNWGKSSLSGKGDIFVIEADEYQNKLQYFDPFGALLTNIDFDHPDFFQNQKDYNKVFEDFIKKIPKKGFLVFNYDDKNILLIKDKINVNQISFGKNKGADFSILERYSDGKGFQKVSFFDKKRQKKESFKLSLPGEHNALNALSVVAVMDFLGADFSKVKRAIKKFRSTERRFQFIGEYNGCLLYDDYAHHPNEIKATILGSREFFKDREIIVGFHPHTFTRTNKFIHEFAEVLSLSDYVYIIDIYASAREQAGNIKVHARDLVRLINEISGNAVYLKDIKKLARKVKREAAKNKIFISMGAGDVWKVHKEILGGVEKRGV